MAGMGEKMGGRFIQNMGGFMGGCRLRGKDVFVVENMGGWTIWKGGRTFFNHSFPLKGYVKDACFSPEYDKSIQPNTGGFVSGRGKPLPFFL